MTEVDARVDGTVMIWYSLFNEFNFESEEFDTHCSTSVIILKIVMILILSLRDYELLDNS